MQPAVDAAGLQPENMTRNFHWLVPTLLKSGVTLQKARAQMDVIGADRAGIPGFNKGWGSWSSRYADVLVNAVCGSLSCVAGGQHGTTHRVWNLAI
jgi:hypothetical protein